MMISPASVVLALMLLQYPYPAPTRASRQPALAGGADTGAVATFNGIFKSADKKYITVEVESGQTMRMYITGSTRYFRNDKQVKVSAFHSDDRVVVDTSRDARMNLLAVRVTAAPPQKKEKAKEERPDLQ